MFRRMAMCLALTASLAACGPTGEVASSGTAPAVTNPSPTSPAPSAVAISEDAVKLSFRALDALATGADVLLASRLVTPGTPVARRIADGLDTARTWLNAASSAQRVGASASYAEAILRSTAAVDDVRAALATLKGK